MFYKAQLNRIVAEGEEQAKPAENAQQQPKIKKKDEKITMTRGELKKKTRLSKVIKKNPFTAAGLGAAAAGAGFMAHKLTSSKPRQSEYNQQYASDNHFINYLFSMDGAENSVTASILMEAYGQE